MEFSGHPFGAVVLEPVGLKAGVSTFLEGQMMTLSIHYSLVFCLQTPQETQIISVLKLNALKRGCGWPLC